MRRLFLCLVILTSLNISIKLEAKEVIQIPDNVKASCEKWGEEYGICPEILEAVCWHETRCKAELENEGCVGITQINPKYHKASMELLGIDDLYDYDQNIHLCAYTLHEYSQQEEDLYYALMCWNSGSTRGKKLFEQGRFTKYAIQVAEESYTLEQMNGKVGW